MIATIKFYNQKKKKEKVSERNMILFSTQHETLNVAINKIKIKKLLNYAKPPI